MAKNELQKLALSILSTKPIVFNPDLARVLGSVTAGLFLNQLLFWVGKGADPIWTYKTVKDFEDETSLSKHQQLTAQKICVKNGVLEVKYKKVPRRRHFKVNMVKVVELLKQLQQEREKTNLSIRRKNGHPVVNAPQQQLEEIMTAISEITQR